jgi:hypothetical protein
LVFVADEGCNYLLEEGFIFELDEGVELVAEKFVVKLDFLFFGVSMPKNEVLLPVVQFLALACEQNLLSIFEDLVKGDCLVFAFLAEG